MALFEILRRGPRDPKSLTMPLTACPEGTAMQEDPAKVATGYPANPATGLQPAWAMLADGTLPAMFVNRAVITTTPLPSFAELSGGLAQMEQPYTSGYEGSLEDADEVIAEGSDYVQGTGSDAITSNTAIKAKCSFRAGKFCVAASGQIVEFLLVEKYTPEVAGNFRGRFKKTYGPFVA